MSEEKWMDVTRECELKIPEHGGLQVLNHWPRTVHSIPVATVEKIYRLRKVHIYPFTDSSGAGAIQPIGQWAFIIERKVSE